ncbi:MAG TPA: SMC-Scp complex subunit ScpB [Candidatus Omnitrophota bacterium]|nr:SMC-Scp complex subunit ScpB [Candidatus Omnitrophota bacterium]HPD84040.1 SMC-Scp complex subunit ScpB [Candidatus Omnitrophota bacterium]HRZ02897.1 SMC-Scp complex subunit ScpB [Candidatus Omnitrophota bacterium]
MSENNYLRGIIESLLFISEKPIMLEQIKDAVEGVTTSDIREMINQLQKEYQERKSGVVILEIAGGYQMLSNPDYAMYIKKFYHSTHKEKLSKPALETLSIIAYKQPVSRLDMELIRGVNCDGVVVHLLDKGLIKIVGRKDVPGRPYLYGTTREFLEYFGLKSLADLPKLEDFSALQAAEGGGTPQPQEAPNPVPAQAQAATETVASTTAQEQPQPAAETAASEVSEKPQQPTENASS